MPEPTFKEWLRDLSPAAKVLWVLVLVIITGIIVPVFSVGGFIVAGILWIKTWAGFMMPRPYPSSGDTPPGA